MASFQVRSAAEQVAAHLRDEMRRRHWVGQLPGSNALAQELRVGKGTIEAALALLEAEGLLVPQGTGRRRRIELGRERGGRRFNIQLLAYEAGDRKTDFLLDLIHQLRELGHSATFASKTLGELKMDLPRVVRFVESTPADIWLVAAASREILQWFAERPAPAYALFGRQPRVNIGGVGTLKSPAMTQAVRRLVELGHQRIVLLTRPERRRPEPGLMERRFLDTLAAHGIASGPFNLPDWENDPADFRRCLDALFAHTPPTALILSQPQLFFTALQHLASRGIVALRDVSMICGDWDPLFDWAAPMVAHLRWDRQLVARQVVRWVNQVARGQESRRQSLIEAEFVPGGTIRSVPKTG